MICLFRFSMSREQKRLQVEEIFGSIRKVRVDMIEAFWSLFALNCHKAPHWSWIQMVMSRIDMSKEWNKVYFAYAFAWIKKRQHILLSSMFKKSWKVQIVRLVYIFVNSWQFEREYGFPGDINKFRQSVFRIKSNIFAWLNINFEKPNAWPSYILYQPLETSQFDLF